MELIIWTRAIIINYRKNHTDFASPHSFEVGSAYKFFVESSIESCKASTTTVLGHGTEWVGLIHLRYLL